MQRLFLRVGAEAVDFAADVEDGFVEGVAEAGAGVAADDEAAGLGHEGGDVADGAADDDVDPFMEMPQREEAFPSMTTRPPWPEAPAHSEAFPFTRTVPDMMFSATLQPTLPWTVMRARLFMPPMK